jgi:hypothetical protein
MMSIVLFFIQDHDIYHIFWTRIIPSGMSYRLYQPFCGVLHLSKHQISPQEQSAISAYLAVKEVATLKLLLSRLQCKVGVDDLQRSAWYLGQALHLIPLHAFTLVDTAS